MLEKELETIVLKGKDVIPFLQKLTPKDKKKLSPFLKKLYKQITEYKSIEHTSLWGKSYSYKPTHSEKQIDGISKACFVCLNKTDIKRLIFNASDLAVSDEYLKNIIPWYTPKWYNDLINEDFPWSLEYPKMMRLYKEGLIEPSRELILNKLPHTIIETEPSKNYHDQKRYYKPEILWVYPETLEDHIWLLFEEESGVNNYYSYFHIENYKDGNDIWIDTLCLLVKDQKLDRERVLSSTLYTATKGFNKTLSGWFFDLLIKLDPSSEEMLDLQDECFAALNCPHSKVVNTVLKYFKKLAPLDGFRYQDFIENTPILLHAETKSLVNATLMILEKIAKTHPATHLEVCQKAAEALINLDKKIQIRAAKLIEKYGKAHTDDLSDFISMYSGSLFHESREVLQPFLVAPDEEVELEGEVEKNQYLSAEYALPSYDTLDDLIFFVSQTLDNNQVYDLDLLLSKLPKLNLLISQENVSKLEPIFKRSHQLALIYDSWNSQIGTLEKEAASYLNDYAAILMKKYPNELENTHIAKKALLKKLNALQQSYNGFKENQKELEHQSIPDYIYQNHRFLFILSKSFIKQGLDLELLSTPTHTPCWIDPEVLVDRILRYEEKNVNFQLYDLQIALGRLPLQEAPANFADKVELIQHEALKKALKYYYGMVEIDKTALENPNLYLQIVLSRRVKGELDYFREFLNTDLRKELGAYTWRVEQIEETTKEYNYQTNKYEPKLITRIALYFNDYEHKYTDRDAWAKAFRLKGIFSKANKKPYPLDSVYNYIHIKKNKYYTTIQDHDELKFLFLTPNNPALFLCQVIRHNLYESTFDGEGRKRNMVKLLKGLYEIWCRPDYSETTYLFLATGLLCSDKVSRELAAEVWIKANSEDNLDNKQLGAILGKLEFAEYAPLKRFTDLLVSNLFHVSKKLDLSLLNLIDAMLGSMNDIPIKNTKKLLEVYMELRHTFPKVETSPSTEEKLAVWKQIKSLKPVLN